MRATEREPEEHDHDQDQDRGGAADPTALLQTPRPLGAGRGDPFPLAVLARADFFGRKASGGNGTRGPRRYVGSR